MSDSDMIDDSGDISDSYSRGNQQLQSLSELKQLSNQIIDRNGYLKVIHRIEEIGDGFGPEFHEILNNARTDMSVEYLLTEGIYRLFSFFL